MYVHVCVCVCVALLSCCVLSQSVDDSMYVYTYVCAWVPMLSCKYSIPCESAKYVRMCSGIWTHVCTHIRLYFWTKAPRLKYVVILYVHVYVHEYSCACVYMEYNIFLAIVYIRFENGCNCYLPFWELQTDTEFGRTFVLYIKILVLTVFYIYKYKFEGILYITILVWRYFIYNNISLTVFYI
jgi:hypothetical protein